VVAAATMPPLGRKVRALRVIRERKTAAEYGPAASHRPDQSRQNCLAPSSR
jgi:hypothetical protein